MKRIILCATMVLWGCSHPILQNPGVSVVNFHHLEHLSEEITLNNERVTIVHVYANYPDYHWTSAAESGPEGVACVDDAARAAVLYLRHFEVSGDNASAEKAKGLLKFVLNMQAPDGEFYNFVKEDHTINREGKTSFKSFGWWAARGMWALCMGYRVLAPVDSAFAFRLSGGIDRGLRHLKPMLEYYPATRESSGYQVPRWLLYESGADATSELLLGLVEYYNSGRDTSVADPIRKIARGMMVMQDGNAATYPFGLHRSWETMWHMWGNGQTQALAAAGRALHDTVMIASARREALGFYSRLLVNGFEKEMDVTNPSRKQEYEQIAYGVRPMAVGLIRLYEATGESEYLKMAGLAASWLFGNNALRQQMYDPASGRCFDGLKDSATVNLNSGAESTIEALMTLVEIEAHPVATNYTMFRRVMQEDGAGKNPGIMSAVFRDGTDGELTLTLDTRRPSISLKERRVEH